MAIFFVVVDFILVEWLTPNVEEIANDRQRSGSSQTEPSVSLLVIVLEVKPRRFS